MLILIVQILMEIIISGEIINDMREIHQIGGVSLFEHGQKETSDRVQNDIMCQINKISLIWNLIGLEQCDLIYQLQNWIIFLQIMHCFI